MKISAAKNHPPEAKKMNIRYAAERKDYRRITAVRLSMVILALGFAAIGLLSLIGKHQVCTATGLSFENAFPIIGGITSFMLGGLFLIAGAVHWDHSYLDE
jgi:hypothetical protein